MCMNWISDTDDESEDFSLNDQEITDDEIVSENDMDELNTERQIHNFIWFLPHWFLYSTSLLEKLFGIFKLDMSIVEKLSSLCSNEIKIFQQYDAQQQFQYYLHHTIEWINKSQNVVVDLVRSNMYMNVCVKYIVLQALNFRKPYSEYHGNL